MGGFPDVTFRGYSRIFRRSSPIPPQPYIGIYGFRRGWGKLIRKLPKSPLKIYIGKASMEAFRRVRTKVLAIISCPYPCPCPCPINAVFLGMGKGMGKGGKHHANTFVYTPFGLKHESSKTAMDPKDRSVQGRADCGHSKESNLYSVHTIDPDKDGKSP